MEHKRRNRYKGYNLFKPHRKLVGLEPRNWDLNSVFLGHSYFHYPRYTLTSSLWSPEL
jgi:hypothetical protein